ncbi:MAG: hypothetical protein GX936_03610 [Clostridiales bacterium]|nr:hypothetical protein [Clostridiales bacterium]
MLVDYIGLDIQNYQLRYSKNMFNKNGDVIGFDYSQKNSHIDYFEIVFTLTNNRLVIISFSLDGFIISIELGEADRKNRISLLRRNFNSDIYVFKKNIKNLFGTNLDYYLDYYNLDVSIDNTLSTILLDDVFDILNKVISSDSFKSYKDIIFRCKNKMANLLDGINEFKIAYPIGVTVLPPSVRPDINNQYIIVQVSSGCKIMNDRKKPCAFCKSYENLPYTEKTIIQLKKHLNLIKKINPLQYGNANRVFLSDGDPLASRYIISYLELITRLGLELFTLAVNARRNLAMVCDPHLDKLRDMTGETVNLAVLDSDRPDNYG